MPLFCGYSFFASIFFVIERMGLIMAIFLMVFDAAVKLGLTGLNTTPIGFLSGIFTDNCLILVYFAYNALFFYYFIYYLARLLTAFFKTKGYFIMRESIV